MSAEVATPLLFTPGIEAGDASVAYWLRQANVRLRREICWCWANRAGQLTARGLPPLADAAAENLDFARYDGDKRRFFESDLTARYLTEHLQAAPPVPRSEPARGSWAWAAREMDLDDAAEFVLALALASRLDAALGAVCAACSNDASRPYPTLALAQRLWDEPEAIVALAEPAHPLFRHGLLAWPADGAPGLEWHQPLDLHAWVARTLLDPASPLPEVVRPVALEETALDAAQEIYLWRLKSESLRSMQLVPLVGARDADFTGLAALLSQRMGRRLAAVAADFEPERQPLVALAAVAWLRGLDLALPEHGFTRAQHKHHESWFAPVLSVPVRWYVAATDMAQCQPLPPSALTPPMRLAPLSFERRRVLLQESLGERARGLETAIAEASRRFRFGPRAIERVARTLRQSETLAPAGLFAACRTEAVTEFGHLAQAVEPRFSLAELVLPPGHTRQIDEIRRGMLSLTDVHYRWGTARAWNEGGLTVLFCGPPGTGKTMAAEALSAALDLPMYRIDLSQVVNKYIGETEKNLKRIFDAAEISDCILFFDEADALFGKRTEVRDAHDRFANIEISYLLERMERFKGLAVLATNRKKDLDEAFMRRLRYVVEFPLPETAERERIWRAVFPAPVDTSELDYFYLARQFPLSGGHIRSIAFNACLLSAESGETKVRMREALIAVKRELDKLNRAASEELFGQYAPIVRELSI
jgi:adenylate kinase family enzyme